MVENLSESEQFLKRISVNTNRNKEFLSKGTR